MATPKSFAVYNPDGSPKTDAVPAFLFYGTRAGAGRAAPAINQVGATNLYTYQPSDADEAIGCVALIATGGDPTYETDSVTTGDKPFTVVLFLDGGGALWAGAAPTVGVYDTLAGAARAAPGAVAAAGAYLWSFTPSSADVALGMAIRVDAPAGAIPGFYNDTLLNEGAPPAPPVPPAPLPPVVFNTLPQTGPDGVDFGQDIDATFDLNPFLQLIGGLANLGQALVHRLSTPRGALPYDANYGYDIRDLLNETMTPAKQAQAQADVQGECRKDERVLSAAVAFQFINNALTLFINVLTSSGPFNLVLRVTAVTVELLQQS